MKSIREVLRLHLLANLSARKIQGATGVARTTVQEYIKRCTESDISSAEMLDKLSDDILNEKLFGITSTTISPNPSKIMPDYNYVHQEMKRKKKTKVTLMFLWEEYKSTYGEQAYAYTQFRVYYRRYKQRLNPSMRQIHIAGEKVFVDYSGVTIPIYNQKTGEVDTAQIFVAVLGASGYTYVDASLSQKQEDFIHSHVLAYQFFGGVPKVVVPDNLKSAIISNNKNGIVINESYASLARHYSMRVEPARPYKPKDKAKAEQGVQAIQRYILACFRHMKFFSVDALNEAIAVLLDRYNNKVIKHLGFSRTELFEELEKQQLQALPSNNYVYEQYKRAKVNIDYHITLLKCYYSVPFQYLQKEVEVRYSTNHVRIYYNNEMIAVHPRLRTIGEFSTIPEHRSPEHAYIHNKWNPDRLRSWAKSIGAYSSVFVEDCFEAVEHKEHSYRKILAVLKMAKEYGNTELELALTYAQENNLTATKSIRSVLDKRLYLQKSSNNRNYTTPTLFNNHENLRGADEYK
jgi:transposase